MTIAAFDIESVTLDIADPENRILSISICTDDDTENQAILFKNEEKGLETFLREASKYEALLGWNSDTFDVPLLKARLRRYGVELDQVEGMPIFLDCMRVHKFILRKQEVSNTLDHIARKHLGWGKMPFDASKTLETFEKDPDRLLTYNFQDAELVWELNKVFGYWSTFDAIVSRADLSPQDRKKFAGLSQKEDGGFGWWRPIMGLVRQFCIKEKREIPKWPTDEEKAMRALSQVERPGGFVETPVQGHHKNVIEFDFKSLYPSIIQTFNLGADTDDPNGDIVPPFGRYTSRVRSITASLLDDLVKERTEVKAQHKARKAEGANEEELAALWGRIEALKIFHNSFYGQFYAPFSPLYHYNSAKNVTVLGQECVKTMLARMREMGLEVVAGDTDSTFVKVPDALFNDESAKKLSEELTAHIAAHLKEKYGVVFAGSFDFKSLISDMAIMKKKFYARLEVGKPVAAIELKGYVRGNTPDVQRDLQRKVFEALFSGGDIPALLASERARFLSAADDTPFLSWMQIHTSRKTVAQVRARDSLAAIGIKFDKYEQVGFFIIGSGKKQRRVAAHWLGDSTVEWMWEDEGRLRTDKSFFGAEEREKAWDRMAKKLDFVGQNEQAKLDIPNPLSKGGV